MDRSYKEDIPKAIKALEALRSQFSVVTSRTDWKKLRIAPLLRHARALERMIVSPTFSQETARLKRGVVMFHADLVYLRENIRALKKILAIETKSTRSSR